VTVVGRGDVEEPGVAFFTTEVGEPALGPAELEPWVCTGALEWLVLRGEVVGWVGCEEVL
jgi:hypothetical protein